MSTALSQKSREFATFADNNDRSLSMSSIAEFTSGLARYLKPADIAKVEEAFHFSEAAHQGQFRVSGEPYISHPVAVATILADWRLDSQALIAAMLHDVVEDTAITSAQINERFGKSVADLVDGVSKLTQIEFQTYEDAQAENFRKMLLAMARDVRVILIKLADRLHNMRTLEVMQPSKRLRIARETLEIYAPIAHRLGLDSVYQELQDLSFKTLYPLRYKILSNATKAAQGNRREIVEKILETVKQRFFEVGLEAQISGREKHIYSTYKKMREKLLKFSQVLDIYGFRVITKDVPSCYLALGVLHGLYKPVPGKFKDYVAIPKVNGYQSLHTTLIGPYGMPIEMQIKTAEMQHIAESGVASHWLYKASDSSMSDLNQKTYKWLQSLLEIQSTSDDAAEFLEHIKVDLFPDAVYVFTPKGRILALPRGASAVDFAYAVHTDIGNRCVAAKINHELMPLRTELKNGDHVEIITASHAHPNPAWLQYVKTGKARSQIRHLLKNMRTEESIVLGERLLNQALREFKTSLNEVQPAQWEKLIRDSGVKSKEEVFADIGLGQKLPVIVAHRLLSLSDNVQGEGGSSPIMIRGTEGMAVQFAECCRPIPGDTIIGFLKKGQGLVIHTHDCLGILESRADPDKWIDVEWDVKTDKPFDVDLKIIASNERGVLAKVAQEIAENGSNIDNLNMDEDHSVQATMYLTLQVANRDHLARIIRRLRLNPQIIKISRPKGENEEEE